MCITVTHCTCPRCVDWGILGLTIFAFPNDFYPLTFFYNGFILSCLSFLPLTSENTGFHPGPCTVLYHLISFLPVPYAISFFLPDLLNCCSAVNKSSRCHDLFLAHKSAVLAFTETWLSPSDTVIQAMFSFNLLSLMLSTTQVRVGWDLVVNALFPPFFYISVFLDTFNCPEAPVKVQQAKKLLRHHFAGRLRLFEIPLLKREHMGLWFGLLFLSEYGTPTHKYIHVFRN